MTRMKDITSSHKSFPKDNQIINIASFSNLNSIRRSLDSYFEHTENSNSKIEKNEDITKEKITEISNNAAEVKPTIEDQELRVEVFEDTTPNVENTKKIEKTIPIQKLNSIYTNSIEIIDNIRSMIESNQPINVDELLSIIPKLVKMTFEDNELLSKALNPGRNAEWFASHSVNVTILSLKISAGLNYSNKQMYALALSTLLHDVGMLKIHPDILNNHGQLSAIQKNKVKNHPRYGASLVSHLKDKYPFIEKTILQEHERWDSSGYPNHLKGDQITPFARIISLADKFESLVHERNYRPAFKPPLAIQKIMNDNHESYDPKVLKAFINEISMYPIGSYVMLNTGQTAQVMSINKNRPVRPLVKILTSNDGKKMDKPIDLNLEKEPLTYITKTVSYLE